MSSLPDDQYNHYFSILQSVEREISISDPVLPENDIQPTIQLHDTSIVQSPSQTIQSIQPSQTTDATTILPPIQLDHSIQKITSIDLPVQSTSQTILPTIQSSTSTQIIQPVQPTSLTLQSIQPIQTTDITTIIPLIQLDNSIQKTPSIDQPTSQTFLPLIDSPPVQSLLSTQIVEYNSGVVHLVMPLVLPK